MTLARSFPTFRHLAIGLAVLWVSLSALNAWQPAAAQTATTAKPAATTDAAKPADPAGDKSDTAKDSSKDAGKDAAAPQAPAPVVLPPEVHTTITKVVGTIDGAEKSLSEIKHVEIDLGRLRNEIDGVISQTTQTADSLRPRLGDIQSQIAQLGPPPDKNAPPEATGIAGERARLNAEATELSGAIKTLEVTWWRARQAIDKITDLRLQLFVKSLTERMSSPVFPSLWKDVARDWPSVSWRVNYNMTDLASSVAKQKGAVTLLLAAALALYLLAKTVVAFLTRYRAPADAPPLTYFERGASASWIAVARAVPGVATAFLIYGGLDYLGLLYYPTAAPAGAALLRASLIYIAVAALLNAVFSPRDPRRRLMPFSGRAARSIYRLLKTLAAIYAADLFFSALGQILYFPLSMSVVQSLIASLGFAAVLIGLLLTPFEPKSAIPAAGFPRIEPRWIKLPLWFAAFAIIAACLSGYVALGRFAAQQLLMTGVAGLIFALLFLAIRAVTRDAGNGRAVGAVLEQKFGLDGPRRQQLAWLTEAALTLALAMVALPLLLLQWGLSGAEIRDWMTSALFGFEIGQFRISLVRVLAGILLFTALLFATRLLQRRLRESVLLPPRMDTGIANSIDMAVGYVGTALAAILAVSYAGFDVTNLAIVAGALSVGIGFGLQSIVNNFVSGLILLIERPIKVGDWVVVGNEQGNVRKISVRSTEIETFDRASLIVPNSELITGRVLNWTHRNAMGRVTLKFSAGPNADPRGVIALLTHCARENPDVLAEPEPLAVFEGYTASATEFSLRVLLADINKGLRTQSDLKVAVFEALKAARMDLPAASPASAAASQKE